LQDFKMVCDAVGVLCGSALSVQYVEVILSSAEWATGWKKENSIKSDV